MLVDLDPVLRRAEEAVYGDPGEAGALLDQVETEAARRRDLARLGRVAELRGELNLVQGRLHEAAAAFRSARRHWLAVGRPLDAVRALLGRAAVRLEFGDLGEVGRMLHDAQRALAGAASGDHTEVVRLQAIVHLLAGRAAAGQGELARARSRYDLAEDLAVSVNEHRVAAHVALERGAALVQVGLARRARDELARAARMFEELGWSRAATWATIVGAEAHAACGDLGTAFALLDAASASPHLQPVDRAYQHLVRASVLVRAGLPGEAHVEAAAAEQALADLGMLERSARAALLCATASLRLGRVEWAETELSTAERLFAECGARTMRDSAQLARARVLLDSGRPGAAAELCRGLLATDVEERAPQLAVRSRLLLARTTSGAEAALLLDEASAAAAGLGRPELGFDLGLARALADRDAGRLREAAQTLRVVVEGRASWEPVSPILARGAAAPDLLQVSDELISVLLEIGDHDAVIEAWQRACVAKTGRFDQLARRTAGWSPVDPTGRVATPPTHRPLPRGADPRPAVLPSVPESPLVEYYVLDGDVIAFVIRDGQVHVRRLPGTSGPARRALAGWRQERLLVATRLAGPDQRTSPALEALSVHLVEPLADLVADLGEDPGSPVLTVVGHRHLHDVPFDALFEQLGHRAPATASVPPREAASAARSAPVLVLAVPDDRAPLVEKEAAMIGELLPASEVAVGEEATREHLFARAPFADLVHIACHGTFRHGNPLFSALHLADGWLRAADVVADGLQLRGAVVVLSACSSGGGAELTREPLGLAWSFVEAGAVGVIASLWDVDDAATLELMTHFYGALAEGEDPQIALRSARRALAEHYPHPYYWAAFRYFARP